MCDKSTDVTLRIHDTSCMLVSKFDASSFHVQVRPTVQQRSSLDCFARPSLPLVAILALKESRSSQRSVVNGCSCKGSLGRWHCGIPRGPRSAIKHCADRVVPWRQFPDVEPNHGLALISRAVSQ